MRFRDDSILGGMLGLHLALVLIAMYFVLQWDAWPWVYSIDDTYIHLAISKNLAEHGVWGVVPDRFTSASSSPLYTLLLAGLGGISGVWLPWPWIISFIASVALLLVMNRILLEAGVGNLTRGITLGAAVLLIPTVQIVYLGMENGLHAVLLLPATWLGAKRLAGERDDPKTLLPFLLLLFFASALRYETLAAALFLVVGFVWRRRFRTALSAAVIAILPGIVYAIFAVAHGHGPLPDSVMMRLGVSLGPAPKIRRLLVMWEHKDLLIHALLPLIGLATAWRMRREGTPWHAPALFALLAAGAGLAHVIVVEWDHLYRRTIYVMALLLPAFAVTVPAWVRNLSVPTHWLARLAYIPVLFLLIFPVWEMSKRAHVLWKTPRTVANIQQQQVQMAEFFREHYHGQAVALNDIGAVSFHSGIRLVDLYGLGNHEISLWFRNAAVTHERMDSLARAEDVRVAAVYDEWFTVFDGVPPRWRKVGEWEIPENVACGEPVVSFYAVASGEDQRLRDALRAFGRELPPGVGWEVSGPGLTLPGLE
ncbi:hypothetical protein GF324_10665 [bacterium]|nr:hypothetical protein [bacterium]